MSVALAVILVILCWLFLGFLGVIMLAISDLIEEEDDVTIKTIVKQIILVDEDISVALWADIITFIAGCVCLFKETFVEPIKDKLLKWCDGEDKDE